MSGDSFSLGHCQDQSLLEAEQMLVMCHYSPAGHIRGGVDSMHHISDHDRQQTLSNFKLLGIYMGDRGRFQSPNQRRGGGSAAALALEPAKAAEFAKCDQYGGLEHATNDLFSGNGQLC